MVMDELRKKKRERLYHRGHRDRAPFAKYAQGKQRTERRAIQEDSKKFCTA